MIIDRKTYIEKLQRSKGNGLIKIITGLRRSGKSFLLKKLFRQHLLDDGVKEDHILIIDMESRKNKAFKDPDYLLDWVESKMLDDSTYYIIIDEVQEVENFVGEAMKSTYGHCRSRNLCLCMRVVKKTVGQSI